MGSLREIFGNLTIISGNNVLVSAINFAAFIVILGALGTAGFGLYTLATSALALAVFFIDFGFGKTLVSDISTSLSEKNDEHASGLLRGYAAYIGLGTVLLSALLFVFSENISDYFGSDLSQIVKFIAILVFFGGLKNFYSIVFQAVSDFRLFSAFLFVEAATKAGFAYAFTLVFGGTVEVVLASIILSSALTLFLFTFFLPKKITKLFFAGGSTGHFVEMFRGHGKWVAVSSQLRNLESNVSPWIVQFFLGVNAVGVYGALVKAQVLIIRVFEPLETVFYPLISRLGTFDDSRKIVFRATKYLMFISLIPLVLLIVFSGDALNLVLGPGFSQHANVFRLLILTTFIFIANIPLKPLLYNLKAQKELTKISGMVLLSTLALGSLLTFSLGLIGIALNHVLTPMIDLQLKSGAIKKLGKTSYSARELFVFDKSDFDLAKKIVAHPKMLLGATK